MIQDLLLIHRSGANRFDCTLANDAGVVFSFETCMRHIVLGDAEGLSPMYEQLTTSDQIFRGPDAYRFFLEVICGLHSPLVGETEVGGQFKTAIAKYVPPAGPAGAGFSRAVRALIEDAKLIREKHLVDLGSQSYGSLLRRELKNESRIHVLGAGHLVHEILPWISKDSKKVFVYCRSGKPRLELVRANRSVEIREMSAKEGGASGQALIIAAPMSSDEIRNWLAGDVPAIVFDLRGTSVSDPLDLKSVTTICLPELLAKVADQKVESDRRRILAVGLAGELMDQRNRSIENRPFGWDDVSA